MFYAMPGGWVRNTECPDSKGIKTKPCFRPASRRGEILNALIQKGLRPICVSISARFSEILNALIQKGLRLNYSRMYAASP